MYERRYVQTIRSVDLWSVLKVAICFYLCALMGALAVMCHQSAAYFLIALPASIPTTDEFDAFDPHYRLIMQWLPLKGLPPVVPYSCEPHC